jgi:uncharacterized damage-inducible protein DinB
MAHDLVYFGNEIFRPCLLLGPGYSRTPKATNNDAAMKAFLQELFRYNEQANHEFIQVLATQAEALPESRTLLSHVVNAQAVWLDRIAGRTPRYGVWAAHPTEALASLNRELAQATASLLEHEADPDLARWISYQNSKGHAFQNRLRDILFHIVNHGSYHRGQLAYQYREAGLQPPMTDYVIRKRLQPGDGEF